MATFGEKIRFIRIQRDMSQEQLAELLDTSKQVVSRYENNQRTPKITVAEEYADKLGVSLSYLIDNSLPLSPIYDGDNDSDSQGMASQLKKAFAEKLNRLMQMRGITQTDISEHLNVTSSTVSDWCNGNKYPRLEKIEKIAHLLGVSASALTDIDKTRVPLKTETTEAIRIFESLPDNLREAALEQLKALSDLANK